MDVHYSQTSFSDQSSDTEEYWTAESRSADSLIYEDSLDHNDELGEICNDACVPDQYLAEDVIMDFDLDMFELDDTIRENANDLSPVDSEATIINDADSQENRIISSNIESSINNTMNNSMSSILSNSMHGAMSKANKTTLNKTKSTAIGNSMNTTINKTISTAMGNSMNSTTNITTSTAMNNTMGITNEQQSNQINKVISRSCLTTAEQCIDDKESIKREPLFQETQTNQKQNDNVPKSDSELSYSDDEVVAHRLFGALGIKLPIHLKSSTGQSEESKSNSDEILNKKNDFPQLCPIRKTYSLLDTMSSRSTDSLNEHDNVDKVLSAGRKGQDEENNRPSLRDELAQVRRPFRSSQYTNGNAFDDIDIVDFNSNLAPDDDYENDIENEINTETSEINTNGCDEVLGITVNSEDIKDSTNSENDMIKDNDFSTLFRKTYASLDAAVSDNSYDSPWGDVFTSDLSFNTRICTDENPAKCTICNGLHSVLGAGVVNDVKTNGLSGLSNDYSLFSPPTNMWSSKSSYPDRNEVSNNREAEDYYVVPILFGGDTNITEQVIKPNENRDNQEVGCIKSCSNSQTLCERLTSNDKDKTRTIDDTETCYNLNRRSQQNSQEKIDLISLLDNQSNDSSSYLVPVLATKSHTQLVHKNNSIKENSDHSNESEQILQRNEESNSTNSKSESDLQEIYNATRNKEKSLETKSDLAVDHVNGTATGGRFLELNAYEQSKTSEELLMDKAKMQRNLFLVDTNNWLSLDSSVLKTRTINISPNTSTKDENNHVEMQLKTKQHDKCFSEENRFSFSLLGDSNSENILSLEPRDSKRTKHGKNKTKEKKCNRNRGMNRSIKGNTVIKDGNSMLRMLSPVELKTRIKFSIIALKSDLQLWIQNNDSIDSFLVEAIDGHITQLDQLWELIDYEFSEKSSLYVDLSNVQLDLDLFRIKWDSKSIQDWLNSSGLGMFIAEFGFSILIGLL